MLNSKRVIGLILLLAAGAMYACSPAAAPTPTLEATAVPPTATTEVAQVVEPTLTEAPATQAPTATTASLEACPQAIVDALTKVDDLCSALSRNQVCYGNTRLEVSPQQANFEQPGDRANIGDIQRLSLTLDRQADSWGLALMSLQANLPATLPGQNVTVVLFGNVQFDVSDEQADVQAFYIQTGIGDAPCPEAPDSGLLVQTPQGSREVVFRLNDVDVHLASTAYFQAVPGDSLVTSVIEGAAQLTAQGVSKRVPAGLRSSVPLDASGLAAGPPSEPEPYVPTDLLRLPVGDLRETVPIASPLLSSTFDSGADDWSANTTTGETIELTARSDDDNGIVCATQQAGNDNLWYFDAPDSWLAQLPDAYGGSLVYAQDQGETDNQLEQGDQLLLVGSDGTTLAYDSGDNPSADYTVYHVPLIETAGWLHPGTRIRATETEFRQVLADPAGLRILGAYRRGDNTSCLDFVLVNTAVQADLSQAPTEPLLASAFDTDTEGWTANDGATPIEYDPAGFVCASDQDFIDAWYFIAGDQWPGDRSAAYGGSLVYELKQSATDGIQNTVPYNVVLMGDGLTLQYQAVGNPSTDFTRYVIPLVASEGWQVAGRDDPPSQDQMIQVLSDLEEMHIIGEFRGDEDTGCLDNVALYPPGWQP
jgi:hypothetical protein